MKTAEGYEIKIAHIPSSVQDFASLRVERPGLMQFSVYPLTSDELREFATELLACAEKMDAAKADKIRLQVLWEAA